LLGILSLQGFIFFKVNKIMLNTLIHIIVIVAIIEHLYFLWLEMFAWETVGKKVFTMLQKELFMPTKYMAANQGLYNGFLALGLIWTFFISDPIWINNLRIFFLLCISIAGIFGGVTISKRIFIIQSIPAIIGLILIFISKY